jgi:guanidinoacetate N-methyltransferase
MDTIKIREKIGFPNKRQDWVKFPALFTNNSLLINGHQVMEAWETNYMKSLASIATKNKGNILEVGFGLGISTKFIQNYDINKHVIIECNLDVIKKGRKAYSDKIKSGKVKFIKGLWEDVTSKLADESFDGILFDTYPLSEKEIHKNHFYFFKEAYRLLKKEGILTYYSDEAKNFSKEHINKLNEAGFEKISFKVCKVNPPKDCIYWNKKTIIAPIIVK